MKKGYADISEEVIKNRTGKSFGEWRKILDEWWKRQARLDLPSSARRGHTASARFLRDVHGVSGWWSQVLTVKYEYEKGLRE